MGAMFAMMAAGGAGGATLLTNGFNIPETLVVSGGVFAGEYAMFMYGDKIFGNSKRSPVSGMLILASGAAVPVAALQYAMNGSLDIKKIAIASAGATVAFLPMMIKGNN